MRRNIIGITTRRDIIGIMHRAPLTPPEFSVSGAFDASTDPTRLDSLPPPVFKKRGVPYPLVRFPARVFGRAPQFLRGFREGLLRQFPDAPTYLLPSFDAEIGLVTVLDNVLPLLPPRSALPEAYVTADAFPGGRDVAAQLSPNSRSCHC